MHHVRSGLKPVLASVAILVLLLSGGIFAYATKLQTFGPSPSDESSQGSQSVTFKLIPAVAASAYRAGQGEAYVIVQGQTLVVYTSISEGTPNASLRVVMPVVSNSGATNRTLGVMNLTDGGNGQFHAETSLNPGSYQIGLLLYDISTPGTSLLVLLSDPQFAGVVIPEQSSESSSSSTTSEAQSSSYTGSYTHTTAETSTTETSETGTETTNVQHEGNFVDFQLVSLPEYLLTAQPSNYPFMRGGTVIGATAGSMYVALSLLGTPNTNFTIVLQQNGANVTIGSVTTNGNGEGVLKRQLNVTPGSYELGLLIFATGSDGTNTLVGVSIPRTQTLNASSSSGTTTSTGTESESSNQSRNEGIMFKFTPVTVASAPSGYSFGHGTAGVWIQQSELVVSAGLTQNPNTEYSLVLTVNGTAHEVGQYTTDSHGNGYVVAHLSLGTGTFTIGLSVYDLSTFTAATLVLNSDPASAILSTLHGGSSSTSTTESQSETESSQQSGNQGEHELKFQVIPVQVQGAPANYANGHGEANIRISDQILRLSMEIEHASPATQFDVALSINGTATKVGELVTNHEGSGEIVAELKLKPGTYLIGVLVYDVSNFQAPTLVMTSNPSSLSAIVVASASHTEASGSKSESESQAARTIKAGQGDEESIKLAVSSLAIPAVVHVGSNNTTFSVLDPRFSVSVGEQADHGLIISISATNVTGPRVLLLNLTQNAFLNLSSHALNVTLDGSPVAQASSVTQVLNPSPGDPARYVIVTASTGFQLLISIPHFSLHTIQIIPIPISQIESLLLVNAEVLAASVVVITVVFAAVYKTRQKLFSLFL